MRWCAIERAYSGQAAVVIAALCVLHAPTTFSAEEGMVRRALRRVSAHVAASAPLYDRIQGGIAPSAIFAHQDVLLTAARAWPPLAEVVFRVWLDSGREECH